MASLPTIQPKIEADRTIIDQIHMENSKLMKQLNDVQQSQASREKESNGLRDEREAYIKELERRIAVQNEELLQSQRELAECREHRRVETIAAESKLLELERSLASQSYSNEGLHLKLEVEISKYHEILNIVLGKASRINNRKELIHPNDDCQELPSELRNAFGLLETAIASRLEALHNEVSLHIAEKEMLHIELSTSNLQRDMLNRDFMSISLEHEALKTAYHSMQTEMIDSSEVEELKKKLNEVERELFLARKKLREQEASSIELSELSKKLRLIEGESRSKELLIENYHKEMDSYKKLVESLKQKIRDLSSCNTKDGREFLDTFEEVMKEEMMTMKAAFENKLKLARDEAESLSRQHQIEITRLQSSHIPYSNYLHK